MTYLTERQRDVLRFIEERIETAGVAPTLQEIADAFDFRSTASAQKHVAHLQRKGFLERRKHQKRGLVLARPETERATAADGEMVVALVGGEVTLKRIFRHPKSMIRLQPSNPALPPLITPARDVQVQGIVVGLLRRY